MVKYWCILTASIKWGHTFYFIHFLNNKFILSRHVMQDEKNASKFDYRNFKNEMILLFCLQILG